MESTWCRTYAKYPDDAKVWGLVMRKKIKEF